MDKHREFLQQILYIFFPRRCRFCGCVISPYVSECAKCRYETERICEPLCPYCGCGKDICTCKQHRRFFSSVTAPFYYRGPVRLCIHRFKFRGKREIAEFLGAEMSEAVSKAFPNVRFDLVCCVPMRDKSIKIRGYNQSSLLCGEVAAFFNIPQEPELLKKLYDTKAQHDLPAHLRSGNIFGVFDVSEPERVKGKTILLCDDVITSGTTLNECAKMLILYGAEKVYCTVAAVGYRDKPSLAGNATLHKNGKQ